MCVWDFVNYGHFTTFYRTSHSLLVFIAGHAAMLVDVLVIMTSDLDSNLTLIFEQMTVSDVLTVASDVLSFSSCPDVVCVSFFSHSYNQTRSGSVCNEDDIMFGCCWPASSYLLFFNSCSLQTGLIQGDLKKSSLWTQINTISSMKYDALLKFIFQHHISCC